MSVHRIVLRVNGSAEQVDVPSNLTLLQLLRDRLATTILQHVGHEVAATIRSHRMGVDHGLAAVELLECSYRQVYFPADFQARRDRSSRRGKQVEGTTPPSVTPWHRGAEPSRGR